MVRVVGFVGRRRAGKDLAIRGLRGGGGSIEDYVRAASVVRVEWSGALKAAAREWYGLSDEQVEGPSKELVDPRWGRSPREIMQLLGTEVGRAIHPETWTRWLTDVEIPREVLRSRRDLADLADEFGARVDPATAPILVCVSGTRFPNEVEAVRRMGGKALWVHRPGLALDGSDLHSSEVGIDGLRVDGEVVNDSTPEVLVDRVRAVIDGWWPPA